MTGWQGHIRQAGPGDVDEVAGLAAALTMSFEFSAAKFRENYPSLLRDVPSARPDQVWSADITYVPLPHGFM